MKFHNCNAQVVMLENSSTFYIIELVSYQTAVCRLCFEPKDGSLLQVHFGRHAKYSPATTRQVTRFIRELVPLDKDIVFALKCFKAFDASKNKALYCTREYVSYENTVSSWDSFGRVD